MKKNDFPLSQVYRLLEPGPVLLVTSKYRGVTNIMTMSWQTMIDFEPPLLACVISNRNASFELIKKSGVCGINIPTVKIAKQVIGCGNSSLRSGVDKFKKFNLTAKPARTIDVPLIEECFASLECTVVDRKLINSYNLFFLQVSKAWVAPHKKYPATLHHFGKGHFMVAGRTIKLPSKMK